jgi:hypothetical protein
MPEGFKNVRRGTDAAGMSDTATPGSLDSFLLDGEAPRLGSAPVLPPAQPATPTETPVGQAGMCAPTEPDDAAAALPQPTLPAPALPQVSPAAPPAGSPAAGADADAVAEGSAATEPRHPMAHLMPAKSQQSESAAWAAELRAKKKAKARRTKIIASVVFLAVCGVVGPPLGRWLVNAINESGSTKPDEPAATVPATTAPAATATAPAPVPSSAPAGLLGLPGQAEAAIGEVSATTPVAPEISPTVPAATVAP